jgi:hypothetical protein
MKITSCDCYKERYDLLSNDECDVDVHSMKNPLPPFEDTYKIVISRNGGVVNLYHDVKCCQFCGKKIEVEE